VSDPIAETDPAFRADVLAGLKAPIPAIPARWLYDRRGSELFDEITRLPNITRRGSRPRSWRRIATMSRRSSARETR
jgi:uncharacterized SAM-dependent methyltransferase